MKPDSIEISIWTNIPQNVEIGQTKSTPLTNTICHFSKEVRSSLAVATSKWPYFTTQFKFTSAMLTSSEQPRIAAYNFFFNERVFLRGIRVINRDLSQKAAKDADKNARHNVQFLLQSLFPITFPVEDNWDETVYTNIQDLPTPSSRDTKISINFSGFLNNILKSPMQKFGYVNMTGTSYTVLGITWINDVINCAPYQKLIRNMFQYIKYKEKRCIELKKDIDSFKAQFSDPVLLRQSKEDWLPKLDTDWSLEKNSKSAASNTTRRLKQLFLDLMAILMNNDEGWVEKAIKAFYDIENYIKATKYTPAYLSSIILKYESFRSMRRFAVEITQNEELFNFFKDNLPKSDKNSPDYENITKDKPNLWKLLVQGEPMFVAMVKLMCTYGAKFPKFENKKNTVTLVLPDPELVTTNEALQSMIEKYFTTERETFETYVMNVYTNFLQLKERSSEKVATAAVAVAAAPVDSSKLASGVVHLLPLKKKIHEFDDELQPKHYQIYVYLDLMRGELSEDLIRTIQCPYKDAMISNMYEQLKFNEDKTFFNFDRPFFDLQSYVPKRGGRTHRYRSSTHRYRSLTHRRR
jgi:hypothetical protein